MRENWMERGIAATLALNDADADGVYVRDGEGDCLLANPALATLLRLPSERLTGRAVARLFPPEAACVLLQQEASALADGARHSCELTLATPHGSRYFEVTHGVLHDECGAFLGVFGRLHDIGDLKRLEREVVETGEREKRRIASDLHDDICQELAAASLIARLLEKKLTEDGPAQAKIAGHIAELTKSLAVAARNLVYNLAPSHLAGESFVPSLHRLAVGLCSAFPVNCAIEGQWPERLTDDHVATHLYRIIHEAMHNAAKHSGSDRITVRLASTPEAFTVTIIDNGSGFVPGSYDGLGLQTMHYRAGLIGAGLRIDAGERSGTTVSCRLPLKA